MSAQRASFAQSASNAAWSFARNVNAILPKGQSRVRLGRPARFSKVGKEYKWQLASPGGHSHYAQTAIEKQWTP